MACIDVRHAVLLYFPQVFMRPTPEKVMLFLSLYAICIRKINIDRDHPKYTD
jgi:hypothetical protein